MKRSVNILTKSGFLLGDLTSTKSIQLAPLGQQLKTVVAELVTKDNSKVSKSEISTQTRCPKSKYLEKLFQTQRERKIWWMKYASNPGRYRFSDFIQTEENIRKVNICSDFEFGTIEMESLEVHSFDESEVLIQSTVSLDQSVLGILFDASEGRGREILRLHRHLAPYQVSILHSSKDHQTKLLRDHIFNRLETSGIRMDLDVNTFKNDEELDEVIRGKDEIGVPFDLIVDQESLNCGLLKLRSRDTTISEVVHISSLPDYLVKILNSF